MQEENWHSYELDTVLEKLNTRVSGLTDKEAKERLALYGYNELEEKKKESYLQVFLRQFKSPIIYVRLCKNPLQSFPEPQFPLKTSS